MRNTVKRFFYSYILRDFQVATINFLVGLLLLFGGATFGGFQWWLSYTTEKLATSGTITLSALPILIAQLVLSAINNDILNLPKEPLHPFLDDDPKI